MHEYDERHFMEKANKRAGTTWVLLLFIGTIYYGLKAGADEISVISYAAMTIIGWAQYLVSGILLKVRGCIIQTTSGR